MNKTAKQQKLDTARDIDPNVRQRMASDPQSSVWVNASAGSGKTKVLTDRVLRLLLPRLSSEPGTKPHKILCLTFTKAGASEMALRIQKTLGEWAVSEIETLEKDLSDLLGRTPNENDIKAARKLFADVIDTPGGLKIMTIHSFCQSVLGRFPLEAGLSPTFSVMDEAQASTLLLQAKEHAFKTAQQDKTAPLFNALKNVAGTINEDQFSSLIKNIISEKRQLQSLLKENFGIDGLYTALCQHLNVQPGITPEEILLESSKDASFQVNDLRSAANTLEEDGNNTDQKHAEILTTYLSMDTQTRTEYFETYASVYFTQAGTLRAKLAGAKISDSVKEILASEASRLEILKNKMNAAQCAMLTRDLIILGQAIIDHYEALKEQQAALDFDDLIFKTETLLKEKNGASWVLYKLDDGLDHILIDEAQDTNPEQWQIIEALCSEFYAGDTEADTARTVFTVGDEKQSIYSFQRASPAEFHRMHSDFEEKIKNAEKEWRNVDLNISFRSTPSILKAVDSVFNMPTLKKGLSENNIAHISFRRKQEGLVELWPLFETETADAIDPWTPPTEIIESTSGASALASHIAKTVSGWIRDQVILPSHNRPIHAGDIMILVRTRTAFVNQLVKALKNHNVPVTGVDRMVLSEQLVIEDLMALISFALLPSDDLTLACVLKSSLIGLNEEQLYELAIDRKESLWDALKDGTFTEITNYLSRLIELAEQSRSHEFLTTLLHTPCPADAISGLRAIKARLGDDALDPLDELLNAALEFERNEIASLQKFLQAHQSNDSSIKRELGEHARQLRIMTVHGSKGLQAPIVILPDTLRNSRATGTKSDERLLWPDKSGLSLPLWSPRSAFDTDLYSDAKSSLQNGMEEEYRRLLYVAMTRAEDRLYIGGYTSRTKPDEDSWYFYIKQALENLSDTDHLEDGTLRLTNPQIDEADRKTNIKKPTSQYKNIPKWLFKNAPEEPYPPKPLVPSRPSQHDEGTPSPLESQSDHKFKRGNLTHKLLEVLPDIDPKKRLAAAKTFIERYGHDLPHSVQNNILEETLAVLEHPEFSSLFSSQSQAEVPITGLLPDKRLISGQIDRLLVTEDTIWIIDYKTNRPAPKNTSDIPQIYINQLQAYADTLSEIYTGRDIKAALLWTDEPQLMPVTLK